MDLFQVLQLGEITNSLATLATSLGESNDDLRENAEHPNAKTFEQDEEENEDKVSLALLACEINDSNKLKRLISELDDKDIEDHGALLLTTASAHGSSDIVHMLLQDGRTDPSLNDNYPLRLTCLRGHLETAQVLIEDKRVDPSGFCNEALRFCARDGRVELCELLLRDRRVNPCGGPSNENSPLRFAVLRRDMRLVRLLAKRKQLQMNHFGQSEAVRKMLLDEFQANVDAAVAAASKAKLALRGWFQHSPAARRIDAHVVAHILALALGDNLIASFLWYEEVMPRAQELLFELFLSTNKL